MRCHCPARVLQTWRAGAARCCDGTLSDRPRTATHTSVNIYIRDGYVEASLLCGTEEPGTLKGNIPILPSKDLPYSVTNMVNQFKHIIVLQVLHKLYLT